MIYVYCLFLVIPQRGGDSNGDNVDNNYAAQQLHKHKKITLYAYLSCNSCRTAEAMQRHANPWNINMIFMD